jgi:hypothetical protein
MPIFVQVSMRLCSFQSPFARSSSQHARSGGLTIPTFETSPLSPYDQSILVKFCLYGQKGWNGHVWDRWYGCLAVVAVGFCYSLYSGSLPGKPL